MHMLFTELPGNDRDVCSRNVLTVCRRHKRESDLTGLIYFANDGTLNVSDPIFSRGSWAMHGEEAK